eukprot:TRINITY_DN96_c0_g1_i5.p1 TRINITY_DN96_c0_g1~~TRINITY_DN96_c0_g1_i5.p1  ORF type:complete len:168 (-),score=23.99 TRINITY_DN96_c0_g1_i5:90-593(-)
MKDANFYIAQLNLKPHIEGGFYRETYRSSEVIPGKALPPQFKTDHSFSTAIYYLLKNDEFSTFHKISADEMFHYYAGGTLVIHMINKEGARSNVKIGPNIENGEKFQFVVPAGTWFCAHPTLETLFTLSGCTVAPGFEFSDFEVGKKDDLSRMFPQHALLIGRYCRE